MCEILYTEEEGGPWKIGKLDKWSEEGLKKLCEVQALTYIEPYHRVRLTEGIKAAAVMFHDGLIWDSILSGYCTYKKRGLPKCFLLRFKS